MGKILVIFLSLTIAISLMSGGYSFWEKKITIRGNIEVARPTPNAGLKHGALSDSIPQIPEGIAAQSNSAQPGDAVEGAKETSNDGTAENTVSSNAASNKTDNSTNTTTN